MRTALTSQLTQGILVHPDLFTFGIAEAPEEAEKVLRHLLHLEKRKKQSALIASSMRAIGFSHSFKAFLDWLRGNHLEDQLLSLHHELNGD
ncbi:MAG TPA: hypothetical protein VMT20_15435 [Terriglobia bacterium]|nr:hypothetical protein [Terriglobia bacterium]